ncbi:acyl-CoA dehydrogenase family protein [bacterium]|nr:acyl-CoA dehydrogenase family protein [candidate division CSSED10-310 bacterium]
MQQTHFDPYNPSEEHAILRDAVRRFTEQEIEPQAAAFDESESFNEPLFKRLGTELGLFGLTVPEAAGGAGMDATAAVIVNEELSRSDPGLCLSYLTHEVLFVNNFYYGATDDQRNRYLAKVISGEWIGAMAMTEPDAGTDVLSMQTTAVRKGDRFIVNGIKQFITNGPVSDIMLVYTKPDRRCRDITAVLIEAGSKGVSVGAHEKKMGMRSSPTSQVVFEDVEVPEENVLGEECAGLVHMMRNLEIERVTLGAQSVGIALRCIDEMARYSICERKQFGECLIRFGQIQKMVAESYAMTHAARALTYNVALNIDPGRRRSLGAASAKLVATTTAELVARNAMQIFGGYGYSREYVLERMLRDAILLSIGGGTNEAMQKNIAADLRKIYR